MHERSDFLLDPQSYTISKLTGQFLDKNLEQQFEESFLKRSKNYVRRTVLIIGSLFFLFLVYDFWANSPFPVRLTLFLCRLGFFVFSLFFYVKPDFFLSYPSVIKLTLYELISITLFLVILMVYEQPHFFAQALAINVFVLGIYFLVPNLLYSKVLLSLFTFLGFIVISLIKYRPSSFEIISVAVYLSLAIFFSTIASYSLSKYKRLDFVNKQYFMELSTKDQLTNIFNRLKFNEALKSQLELARRYENTFSLIMFDIDHFKHLNDQNGHIFGDKVLIAVASLVQKSIREVDVFARWGGEEFVILLPRTHCHEASALAERLRKSICEESRMEEINLTCSFGVTSFTDQDNEDSIMNRVDIALYKAKENGRNVVVAACNPKIIPLV